jgi:hypothetical protein
MPKERFPQHVFSAENFPATPCHLMFRRRAGWFGTRDANTGAEAISRHACAAGKTSSCRKKNFAQRVAFGLPQDSTRQLMFEACVNHGSELSAFRDVGFHVERLVAGAAHRPRMPCQAIEQACEFPWLQE